jgi:hypothetical protein
MKRITMQKLLLIVLMFFSLTAFSQVENSDFAKVIDVIKTAKSVKINAISPMGFICVYSGNYEGHINNNGAKYIFEDAIDVAKIVDMFLLGKPTVEERLPSDLLFPNMVIYFTLSNGQEIKFLLGNQYSNENPLIYGKYSSTNNLSTNFYSASGDLKMNIYKYLSNSEKNMSQKFSASQITSFNIDSWRYFIQRINK